MVELRHLRYFIAVAEERNFTRAAERLHMAQSPLSAAIRQLEHEISAELLVRSSRGVTLTPAGDVLLHQGRRILELVAGAIAAAQSAGAGELGTLRIGYSWHDILLEICRRAGVEPTLSPRAFHSAGDTGTLVSSDAVALAPKSVTGAVPGAVAIPLGEPDAMLETYLVWHRAMHSAAADKLRALARAAFRA